jgi:hypothetical protein
VADAAGLLLTTIAVAIGWMTLTATEAAARTAHSDAQEALRVAREAQSKQTLKLSDQDIAKIIATVEADLRTRAKEQRQERTPDGPR